MISQQDLYHSINVGGKLFDFSHPHVMAIVNLTPDSFYEKSRVQDAQMLYKSVAEAYRDGATIIDIGAYSTRPSAENITEKEELDRLKKYLPGLTAQFPQLIFSIDTFRANVARWAVESGGVHIINDISGGELDNKMFQMVAELQVPYILMHSRGTPQTMSGLTDYEDIVADILRYFQEKISRLTQMGVKDIIIDPGIGFAKTLNQNYKLLSELSCFKVLDCPILLGVSRKSMIYKTLGITPVEALNGTTVLHTLGLINGANILRVHDVRAAKETIKLLEKYKANS